MPPLHKAIEAKVQTTTTLNLSKVAKTGAQVLSVGWAGTASDSESMQVALATDLAPHLGKGLTMVYLPPPKLLFLRDATAKVWLNIVSSLALLNTVVGVALLTQ